jgi:uncharacterized protein
MSKPKTFTKFKEVQAELERTGSALFRDADGVESLVIKSPYQINYIHSYAEDTPFFLGLSEGKLKGSKCSSASCGFVFATPRGHCMVCGEPTTWIDLPPKGRIHSWTTCRLKDAVESDLYIGMPVEARFDPNPRYSITDIWFVPAKAAAPSKKAR